MIRYSGTARSAPMLPHSRTVWRLCILAQLRVSQTVTGEGSSPALPRAGVSVKRTKNLLFQILTPLPAGYPEVTPAVFEKRPAKRRIGKAAGAITATLTGSGV